MDESWGLKSLLDTADDTAVFIVNDRTDTILYCNYYTTLKTGAHEGSQLKGFWDDIRPQMKECGEGRTYRFTSEHTPFGDNKNVTITRVVWTGGVKAYAFLVTNHLENKEERDREIIFKALGKSYISIHVLDEESGLVYTIFRSDAKDVFYFRPEPYKELMEELLEKYIHPDDIPGIEKIKNIEEIEKELADDGKGLSMQFRRRTGDDYRWCEVGFWRVKGSDGKFKTVLTQRDIHTERIINNDKLSNKIIMDALANAYRSVYLVDLDDGSYSTVKPDELLFGIRDEGDYSDLMSIVEELIPDEAQKDDLRGYFSLESLRNAFEGEADNIGREYPSVLTQEDGWMSINAFRPPSAPGLDNKCVVTFMDITEHKRVEKERNEQVIALDVLSSKYTCVFFVNGRDYTYHALKLPPQYKYFLSQFSTVKDIFAHYLSAYVLEDYRDMLRSGINSAIFAKDASVNADNPKQEYIYKTVNDQWIRLSITLVPDNDSGDEFVVAFEDYTEIMEQHSMSNIYGRMMLADYEHMYEYDPAKNRFYELLYDGERLMRKSLNNNAGTLEFFASCWVYPDDSEMFTMACRMDTVKACIKDGKTVNHLYLRCRDNTEADYKQFMFGFHYYEAYGRKYVLITERDANKEII